MAVRHRVAAILFLWWGVFCVLGCDGDELAIYEVKLKMLWSEERFPKDYPTNRPKAQWSIAFGQSHNSSYALYHVGEVASSPVRSFTQFGKIDALVQGGEEEPRVYDQFTAPAVGKGTGETQGIVLVDGRHSLVSLICHMIPSPDWFIGVDSLDLCVDSSWVDQITLDLEPLDGGAASGLTFTAPRWETVPPEPVTKHGPRVPNHPAAGFYYPNWRELPVIAKAEFTRKYIYSTEKVNELVRKDILAKLNRKDEYKGVLEEVVNDDSDIEDISTKNYVEHLMELEEEPFGTPIPNQPENNVVVVTKPPSITSTTEREFDDDLRSMDDVVLAVARGQKLGLNKHLPRHFRSRLHHAVNRIQPDDCLVSEWGEWSPCSATCGFGNKYRSRRVLREKRGDGRHCPDLVERDHCGDVNSCAHVDYFHW
ncbi:spondin-1-like [Ostrinia nubilalis]|uniref:spondin-1-like n=1 Tax=Ostrinia nubilalis TaxID=29057 RepID=UPI00308240A2